MARAASGKSRKVASALGPLPGLISTATRTALGASSCSRPNRLAATSQMKMLMPVALPPGRARLDTRPTFTGSSPTPNTIGIVVVAALAALAASVPPGVAIMRGRCRGIEDDRDAGDTWSDLFKKLQPFAAHLWLECREAGNVAAWMGQVAHETAVNRIDANKKHNRDRGGLPLNRTERNVAIRHDHVGREAHQLCRV